MASTSLQKKLRSAAHAARIKPPLTHKERLAHARKQRKRDEEAAARTLTAAGLAPAFAAKLQAAARAQESDPEARALVEKARLAKRIEIAKRESGVGNPEMTPTKFMGASQPEYEAAVDRAASGFGVPLPPRISDARKAPEKKGKR